MLRFITVAVANIPTFCMLWAPSGKRKASEDFIVVTIWSTLGYRTNVVAVPIFHSLFFTLYETIKAKALDNKYSLSSASMISTSISGIICNFITNPIWVVRTRLMAQFLHHEKNHYASDAPFDVIREMYKKVMYWEIKEGFQSLFKGLGPSLLSVIGAIAYFNIY